MFSRRQFLRAGALATGGVALAPSLYGLAGLLSEYTHNGKTVALVINPDNDKDNVEGLYNFLLKNKVQQEDIELLYLLGQRTQWHIPKIPVNGGASRSELEKACERLGKRVEPHDTLFVYFQYHGSLDNKINNGEPSMQLRWEGKNNYWVSASEFANYVGKIPSKRMVLATSQCYGYDFGVKFKQMLSGREVTVLSFAKPGERAYSSDRDLARFFSVNSEGSKLMPPLLMDSNYDLNRDGHISLKEASTAFNSANTANTIIVNGHDFYFKK